MNRKSGILAAGTLTGLVVIIILVFGMGGLNAAENNSTALPPTSDAIVVDQPTADTTNSESLQTWQTYSSELENAVETLQTREGQYQAELNAANETIIQLQDQINTANSAPVFSEHEDHDEDHHDEGEHDEHEGYENDD